MRYLLFSTSIIYTETPTGGIRRFRELSEYVNKVNEDTTVCSFDETHNMKNRGFSNHVHIEAGKNNGLYRLLPPIFRIFFTNRRVLSKLRRQHFDKVVVFDEAPTTALILWGFSQITMLIRKDSIGYEKVSYKGNPAIGNLKCAFLWFWELICVLGTKRIITQCVYDKNVIKKRHGLLSRLIERKTCVQINNVNPSWIISKSEEARRGTPFQNHLLFRVCFIGGFGDKRKGQDFFLDVAVEILKQTKDIEFVLVGGGPGLESYQKEYSHPNIQFLGRMSNPLTILCDCDLLVVPSLADSCPNTVMEALYNRVPVLGSKRGGIPEILVDQEFLFDINRNELIDKIQVLKNNVNKRSELVKLQEDRRQELTFDWSERIYRIL